MLCTLLNTALTHSWGYFRGVEVDVPGLANDQSMLNNSYWNNPGILTEDNEFVGADLGYKSTEHVNLLSPFTDLDTAFNSTCAAWNAVFNSDQELVGREFGFIKNSMKMFDRQWRRKRELFPLALRVALKLANRYWRLNKDPFGLTRQSCAKRD